MRVTVLLSLATEEDFIWSNSSSVSEKKATSDPDTRPERNSKSAKRHPFNKKKVTGTPWRASKIDGGSSGDATKDGGFGET